MYRGWQPGLDRSIFSDSMRMSFTGRSWRPVGVLPMALTTSIPSTTSPNTVCRLSSHGVGTRVTKNWLPLVFGPALAIDRMPGLSWRRPGANSSSNW